VDGRRDHKRILIYSHDTFGLGHLRRCRAIAHSLVDADSSLSVLILSGSPIIGSFDFRSRVDFVRIPGVIKLRNGEYVSLNPISTSRRRSRCGPRSSAIPPISSIPTS
jgi:predicted glycosyltransferase